MPVDVLVGLQWGDEGKGKLVGPLMKKRDYKVVARYQGGNNAGHTVYYDGRKLVFKQIPSGIVVPRTYAVMGNGMVINLKALYEDEMRGLEEAQIDYKDRLFISDRAHVILPHHVAAESSATSKRIDTTKKGIGYAYADKAARRGIRVGDLAEGFSNHNARQELIEALETFGTENPDGVLDEQMRHLDRVMQNTRVCNTAAILNEWLKLGYYNILAEGAQGTLLDIDHGTYPFVTSSNTTAGGAATGLGIGPATIKKVIGVAKAYTTRVGEGPFPTELKDGTGQRLRERGNEFGSVTGRPRRCGWLDLPLLRYAIDINGATELALTKIDVLDEEDTIRVCVDYNGLKKGEIPALSEHLAQVTPVYEKLPGWITSTRGAKRFLDLPQKARDYIDFLRNNLKIETSVISTGPEEHDIIIFPEQ